MAHYVHEERTAVVVCVSAVELRKSAGEIVAEDFVRDVECRGSERRDAPRLIVDARNRSCRAVFAGGAKLLYIFGEIEHAVTAGRPLGHLKLEWLVFQFVGDFD